ncbi:unnamed protein product, partial [Larinioides sclopetarius]
MIIPKDGLYPFLANAIPEEFKKKSEAELSENDASRRSGLQQLKECVLGDKDLDCRTTDDFLIKFLRARKFNIPKAFSLLKKHMGFKSKNKDIFTGFDYDVMAALIKDKVFGFLPHRCKDGCAVLVVHLDNWNPSKFGIKDISRGIVLFFYHSIRDPLTQINGYKLIFDVSSSGLKHLRFCTPSNLYLLYNGTQPRMSSFIPVIGTMLDCGLMRILKQPLVGLSNTGWTLRSFLSSPVISFASSYFLLPEILNRIFFRCILT